MSETAGTLCGLGGHRHPVSACSAERAGPLRALATSIAAVQLGTHTPAVGGIAGDTLPVAVADVSSAENFLNRRSP